MASQNQPSPTTAKSEELLPVPESEEPEAPEEPKAPESKAVPVDLLLSVVEKLHKHLSPEIENLQYRVPRSSNNEENETNHPVRRIPISPPLLRSAHLKNEDSIISDLRHQARLVKDRLKTLKKLGEVINSQLSKHITPLDNILQMVEKESSCRLTKWRRRDVEDITRKISDIVCKLPPLPNKKRIKKELNADNNQVKNNGKCIEELPGLQEMEEDLNKFEAYRQVKQKFMELEIEQKMCLLSFAAFPENREVHRTMLMYWWIGEGILRVEGAEETVREILKEFTENKLVEPVEERRKVAPSSYKMTSFVHSSVIHLSKKIGLFCIYRKGHKPTMNKSKMGKVCLVEGSSKQPEAGPKRMLSQDIETVFNVSERNPEFTFKWFSEQPVKRKLIKLSKPLFKSLHVFYLGRWERTKKRPIQVRNLEFMKCLKRMKNLRFLSFQGISSIGNLKSSVCTLHKLIVLDLRECSDLTKLSEKIGSLHSLVYLDMTGCYMLEWIPIRLILLNNLEVLKGFVVSDTKYERVACTLSLLTRLKRLRKLSIEIQRDDLDVHQLMVDVVMLKALTSLRVTWRRGLSITCSSKPDDFTEIESLPYQLTKLDLQRFPHERLPTWLQPHKLLHLTKLHIGGGRLLRGFGELPETETECAVKVLRLTSLPKLRVRWIELKETFFPNLTFLAKYECPRITLTPCDGNGIWRSDQDD